MNELGTMLRDGRKRTGLSQRAVAEATGVDFTYLSKIETGAITTGISEGLLLRLADLYGLDSDVVLVTAHKCPAVLAGLLASDLTAVQLLRAYARARRSGPDGPTPAQVEAATRRFLDECKQPGDESRAMRAALTAGWSAVGHPANSGGGGGADGDDAVKTITFTVRMPIPDDADPADQAAELLRYGVSGVEQGVEVLPETIVTKVVPTLNDPMVCVALDDGDRACFMASDLKNECQP